MFEVKIGKSFSKELKKIDTRYHQSIREAIDSLKEDPYSKTENIKNPNLPDRKTRDGVYRILFNINKKGKIIEVRAVKHRKDIYNIK